MVGKFTDRQQRFVQEYPVDFNATKAAVRSGYSEHTAGQAGHRLLKNAEISTAIKRRLDELSMSAEEVTKRLTDWGRGDFSPFLVVDEDGSVRVDLSTDEAKANIHLIKKIDQTERRIPGGDDEPDVVERRTRIELHDAKDATITMGRRHQLFIERHEIDTFRHDVTAEMTDAELRVEAERLAARRQVITSGRNGGNGRH
jgi:phage terminase small subunit